MRTSLADVYYAMEFITSTRLLCNGGSENLLLQIIAIEKFPLRNFLGPQSIYR